MFATLAASRCMQLKHIETTTFGILLEIYFLKSRSAATVEMSFLWSVLGDFGKIMEDVRFRKARSKKSNNSMGWMLGSRKREPYP